MKELGEYLKETRENNSVSIEEASDDLKLDKRSIENIENGNSKAFKDVLELKDMVKKYAKYLGLDPEKVVDEFNDFLFEHTSKISLKDILEAEKKQETTKKVVSPYTKVRKEQINNNHYRTFIIIFLMIIIIILLLKYISMPKVKEDIRELNKCIEVEVI